MQGTVLAVARVRNAIYLNFGKNWHRDFSVRIPLGVARAHSEWDRTLESLKGRKIEVRGWIERSNGPLIEISQPSEIVVLDGNSHDGLLSQAPPATGQGNEENSGEPLDHRDSAPERASPDHDQNGKRPEPSAPAALDL